jgi:hypothetical protein
VLIHHRVLVNRDREKEIRVQMEHFQIQCQDASSQAAGKD